MYEYKAKCVNVVDGDTVDLEVDLGFRLKFRDRFRLLGIDTPEIYGKPKDSEEYKKGMAAKQRVEELILNKELTLHSFKCKQGKYGRWLADLRLENGELLCGTLLAEGHAVEAKY